MTDLEKLIPQDTLVQVAGETIAISPLKVGQLPAFLRVAVGIALELKEWCIKGRRFGVDHPAPNGHAIVLHGRLQRRFLAG